MATSRALRVLLVLLISGAVTACGGAGDGTEEASTEEAGATGAGAEAGAVTIADSAFDPAEVNVPAGETVQWTNDDALPHTVTFDDDDALSSDTLNEGDTHEVTFDEPGEYAYHCHLHPSMKGTVTVE